MTNPYDTYTSPLATRNASAEMLRIWSPRHKFSLWRKIWVAVAKAQKECGLPITDEQIAELEAHVEVTDEDIRRAEEHEGRLRHDVMAHVHAYGDVCPGAKGILHLGMTSQDVVCNADYLLVRSALASLNAKLLQTVAALCEQAQRHVATPTLGFTHYQPAQPTTVGRRFALWAHDLHLAHARLVFTEAEWRPRGLRGATGTQASFAALAEGRQSPPSEIEVRLRQVQRWLDELAARNYGSAYQYEQTARRLIRALARRGKIGVLNDEDLTPFKAMKEAGWVDQEPGYTYQTIQTYKSQIAFFLEFLRADTSRDARAVVDLPAETWTVLEDGMLRSLGIQRAPYVLTGQTYARVADAMVLGDLASTAAVLHKIATDIRLLSNRKELDEPFGKSQVGSSAMPYKRNPMRCERICGLSRFVMNLVGNAYDTAATQWLERTLDDSSNRRLSLPEAFLALDGALDLMHNVASGLEVHEAMVRRNLMAELPFLATENILMAAVKAGGDRQDLHERIRVHSQEAGRRVKDEGLDNDLIERLKGDPAFGPPSLKRALNWDDLLDPMKYVGRSVEQTERFIREVVEPLRERYGEELGGLGGSEPRV